MPQKTNLNVNPYYEDFDASKNFYKILFRPGYSIQGRELTQIQSILQNQVESFGKYAFKQGQLVIPGEVGLNTKLDYVKLSSVSEVAIADGDDIVYRKYDITLLVGQKLRGLTSGVVANVLSARIATEESSDTVYVSYQSSGNSNAEETFRQGETLEVVDGVNTPLLVVGTDGSVLPTSIQVTNPDTGDTVSVESPAMGYASAVKVEEGIYFVNGFFVRNDEELLVIDEYYNRPSAKVGFTIKEDIVTPEEDSSIYDNAIGSSNYTAPGAHRLRITLELKEFALDAITDKNFIQLLTVRRGQIQRKVAVADYSLLEQTLARRTFDESGDYVVQDFSVDIREYAQRNNNKGLYSVDEFGLYNGLTIGEAGRKMIASIGPGKAYIRGFEIVNKETKYLELNKARESLSTDNVTVKTKGLPTYNITNVFSSVSLNKEGADLSAYPTVYLSCLFNDGYTGLSGVMSSDNYRQSIERRGKVFDIVNNNILEDTNYGVKTLTLLIKDSANRIILIEPSDLQNLFPKLYYVKTRGNNINTTGTLEVLSFTKVFKPTINDATDESAQFLEVTVAGLKSDLDLLLVEFDESDTLRNRNLFTQKNWAENDAQGGESTIFAAIADYSDTITPIIGTAKPSNFYLKSRGDGFNPDADVVLSKGKLPAGGETYNANFALSYFDPKFFTKIKLQSIPATGSFEAGKYVYGLTSKAYGVVESGPAGVYSFQKTLFVTTLSGKFLDGETIKDEDGNLVKIAKDNTISHFICVNRGEGYPEEVTIVVDGVPFDSSIINLSVVGGGIYRAEVLDPASLQLEYTTPPITTIDSGAINPTEVAVIAPVLNRNSVTTFTPSNVKSLGCGYGANNENIFTADIIVDDRQNSSVTAVTDFTFFGKKGSKFLESTSFSADASSIVQQGDLIQFADSDNNAIRAIVQYATQQRGSSKTRIYLDETLVGDVSATSVVLLRPKVENPNGGTLIFPTGSKQVSRVSAGGDDTKIKYYFRRDFVAGGSQSGGIITFAAQLPFGTQSFAPFTEENYILTVLDSGDAQNDLIENGDIVYIDPEFVEIRSATDISSGLTSGSIQLNLPNTYFSSLSKETITANNNYVAPKLKLTATLEVTNAKPRLKTAIKNKRIVVSSSGDRVIPFRGTDYDNASTDVLSYSDAYKLRYVYEGTSSQPPQVDSAGNLISGTDVTSRFTFDNGQRDTVYDVSRLVIKPGIEPTVGQLIIGFDYFEHSQGDFVTIDSYLHEAGVLEEEIPSFNSTVLGNVELKNVFDFRPKVNSDTIVPGFQDTASLEITTNNFSGIGSVVSSTPAPDRVLPYTLSFSQIQYLDRIDGIFLNKNGEFVIKEGNSSLNPSKPDPVKDAIPLFYAYIPAYTSSSKDVRITPVEHKRYTMKDIGKLEKRIERLEYYTVLSILEQQALNMQIKDEVGLDRFKSGFFVDNFETHGVGNLVSLDYQCAIDSRQSVLRPQAKEDSFTLREVYTREDQRSVAGYKRSGDIVTLPYSSLRMIGNDFASKTINPNPFVVFQYVGEGHISPQVDQWYDTSVEPLIVDTNTSLYNIFNAKEDPKESFASLYNSFVVNCVGTSSSFTAINSLGNNNTLAANATVKMASVGSSSNIGPQNNDLAKGVQTKSVGESVVATSLQFFARSIPIKFVVGRLKPRTKVSVFLEGRNIDRWVNPDLRYTGIAGNSLSAFNGEIVTDDNGNASGLILLPAGLPPKENATWGGEIESVDYDTSSEEVRFTTGELTFRFTSSSTDEDKSGVDTYAEIKYYPSGTLPQNPSSIISTKPSTFKANEGVQFVESNTDNPLRPNPLAQIFKVENFDGGVFVTGADLYFEKKSESVPVRVYLSNVDFEKPSKNIVPGTERTLTPETYLKCYASGNANLTLGESIVGTTTAASGPLYKVIDKNGVELTPSSVGIFSITNEQVYTLVLKNHNGRSFRQNEDLEIASVSEANAKNGTSTKLTIAKDSGQLSDIRIIDPGRNYDSAILTIESPQLPGGSVATAVIKVSNGKIYDAEVSLPGFGYTEAPSVVIKGIGNGAGGCLVETFIDIDTPAVRMGVASDSVTIDNNVTEAIQKSVTPTHFEFDYPVYLENDSEYALVVETDSTDYTLWSSKLGETDISTSTVITTQPALGSLYKSQNTENWMEDQDQDLKFTLYRAEFDTSRPSELLLRNDDLGYELLDVSPIETNGSASSLASAKLFKNNNSILKISHRDNGFEDRGNSYVYFKGSENVGGITSEVLNNTLFEVQNSGLDSYNIQSASKASSTAFGGGSSVYATFNRKYEVLYPQVHYLTVSGTSLNTNVQTTNVVPVDSNTQNYVSYSQTEYEKTFLNEPHYFDNQKVIASEINETLNSIERSLTYQLKLASTSSHLSPVIDLSSPSVKLVSNRVEKAEGSENRFGRRDQILTFYPVYQMNLASTDTQDTYEENKAIEGRTSGARGVIAKVDGATVWVKLKTKQGFLRAEDLVMVQVTEGDVSVASTPQLVTPTINSSTQSPAGEDITITARNASSVENAKNNDENYDNRITGKSIIWDKTSRELTLRNDTQPIGDDFTSRIDQDERFNRVDREDQLPDIFRVGDVVSYPNQPIDEALFMEVASVAYTNGIDFVAENTSKNGSAVAKYVTKEVYISNPATAIDVHILANVRDISEVEILYKIKRSSSQENFEDLEWVYFNESGEPDEFDLASSENTISSIVERQEAYQDLKYSVSDLPEFTSFAIKVVMKGIDPAYVPKIQDIRAVAAF